MFPSKVKRQSISKQGPSSAIPKKSKKKKESNICENIDGDITSNSALVSTKQDIALRTCSVIERPLWVYQKQLLYCDAPFDIRYFTSPELAKYDEEYQRQLLRVKSIEELKADEMVLIGFDQHSSQLKDPSILIKQLNSLPSIEAREAALQISLNYSRYSEQVRCMRVKKREFNPRSVIPKVISVINQLRIDMTKYLQYSVICANLERRELNKHFAGLTKEFGRIIFPKKHHSMSIIMKIGNFSTYGNMTNLTKLQMPFCDRDELPIKAHTFDGFVIPCICTQLTVPLSDDMLDFVIVKAFKIEDRYIQKIKEIRETMEIHGIESVITKERYTGDSIFVDITNTRICGETLQRISSKPQVEKPIPASTVALDGASSKNTMTTMPTIPSINSLGSGMREQLKPQGNLQAQIMPNTSQASLVNISEHIIGQQPPSLQAQQGVYLQNEGQQQQQQIYDGKEHPCQPSSLKGQEVVEIPSCSDIVSEDVQEVSANARQSDLLDEAEFEPPPWAATPSGVDDESGESGVSANSMEACGSNSGASSIVSGLNPNGKEYLEIDLKLRETTNEVMRQSEKERDDFYMKFYHPRNNYSNPNDWMKHSAK